MAETQAEHVDLATLRKQIDAGARFVCFQCCISFLFVTVRRSSPAIFVAPGESLWRPALRYSLLSLAFGWWGIPWGPIYTLQSLWITLRGGRDVTAEMLERLEKDQVW